MEECLAGIADSLDGLLNRDPWITYYDARLKGSDGIWRKLTIIYDPSEAVLKATRVMDTDDVVDRRWVTLHYCDRNNALHLANAEATAWQSSLSVEQANDELDSCPELDF